MNAIIYHSMSKRKDSEYIAKSFQGDLYQISPIKPIRNIILQIFAYGFKTAAKRTAKYEPLEIDFDKYNEVTLVSPVWVGQVNCFMRQFLQDKKFYNKKVRIINVSSSGDTKTLFDSYKPYIDISNDIIEQVEHKAKTLKKA